ncbi:hypothetical protein ACNPPY_27165 [Achromobacter sp. AGC78]|jgi:hypothetical protein|uniref:Uncharacterized protein n=1 Tax=Achromobacter spanius TaxID=217203 RepID=A0AA42LV88_9BURK|nr:MULTISPECIES: hypothetical protein [Achromobacter]MCS3505795.1 hypothetical protein [Achromobacter sp. JUb104]MDH0740268.1 hypothetical protein [Achromobacter spanius]
MDSTPLIPAAVSAARHSIFIYTEEQRGNQLVESPVIGMLSDVSGSDKLIVAQDPHSGLKFIYRVDHESSNLDAAAITEQEPAAFDGKTSVQINAMSYRLGNAENAMKLLRGKKQWIQDKGAVLSVLLQNAAARKTRFASARIERDRMRKVPAGVPIEYLPT